MTSIVANAISNATSNMHHGGGNGGSAISTPTLTSSNNGDLNTQSSSNVGNLFSLVDSAKYGMFRECVAYIEKCRLQSPHGDLSNILSVHDENGNTALHWACYKKHRDIVKYLLGVGANPNIGNLDEAQTPLHWACISGDAYIVKYILNSGGDPLQVDRRGYNALIHATQYNEINIARMLIERTGVPVQSADHLSQTALHWAAYQGHTHMLLYLTNKGADIHSLDSYGRTPLHWACYKGNRDAVRALCDFGSDLTKRDNDGNSPMELAKQQDHGYIARTLAIYPFHPLRKLGPITYNLFWIFTSITLYCSFAFSLVYFNFFVSILGCIVVGSSIKFIIEPLLLPYTPNPLLPTWMLTSFTNWIIIYLNIIIGAFPNSLAYHIITIFILCLYYYYAFKLFFSDPGTISPSTSHQDSKDFQQSIESETKIPEICSTCLINKPIRARHCRTCRRCVARFDHHCGWINNCVGVGNNLQFIILLLLFTCSYLVSMTFNFSYLALNPESPSITSFGIWLLYHYQENKGLFIYMFYETLIMAWIGRLIWIQITGVFNNTTMFELMRPPKSKGGKCNHSHNHNHSHGGHQEPEEEEQQQQPLLQSSSSSSSNNNNNSNNGSQTNLRDNILMPTRNNQSLNPFDKGHWRLNFNEFIYETSKWYRYFNHKEEA